MIILASNSPRRKELITEFITSDFLIMPSEIEEKYDDNKSIEENIIEIAKHKGESVFKKHPHDVVISADTMVIFNHKIYGKPKNIEEAKKMLLELSDNVHQVMTSYSIFYHNKVISKIIISDVKFKLLSLDFINQYINECNPLDKAGSYGIQDDLLKTKIEYYKGSLTNIIGLPVEELKKDLEGLNII